jgi:hypothetical protein
MHRERHDGFATLRIGRQTLKLLMHWVFTSFACCCDAALICSAGAGLIRHLVVVEHDVTQGRLRPVLLRYRDSHEQLNGPNLITWSDSVPESLGAAHPRRDGMMSTSGDNLLRVRD